MQIPRLRFSVRSAMIAVGLCALAIWLAPICERSIWTWIVIRDVKRGESGRYSKLGYAKAGPRALEALRDALRSDTRKTRLAAALTLGTMGSDGEAAVPDLVGATLHDQDKLVRIYAASSLGEIGAGASSAVEPLLKLVQQDTDPQIASAAIQALGRIGLPSRRAVPVLAAIVKDSRHNQRMMAAMALCRIGPEGRAAASVIVPDLIELLGKGQTPGERRFAAEILAEMGSAANVAIPDLAAATRDPDQNVRRAASMALKALDGPHSRLGMPSP